MEQEKGNYYMDPETDRAITESVRNGVQILYTLDCGNPLYEATPCPGNPGPVWRHGHPFMGDGGPTKPESIADLVNYARFVAPAPMIHRQEFLRGTQRLVQQRGGQHFQFPARQTQAHKTHLQLQGQPKPLALGLLVGWGEQPDHLALVGLVEPKQLLGRQKRTGRTAPNKMSVPLANRSQVKVTGETAIIDRNIPPATDVPTVAGPKSPRPPGSVPTARPGQFG